MCSRTRSAKRNENIKNSIYRTSRSAMRREANKEKLLNWFDIVQQPDDGSGAAGGSRQPATEERAWRQQTVQINRPCQFSVRWLTRSGHVLRRFLLCSFTGKSNSKNAKQNRTHMRHLSVDMRSLCHLSWRNQTHVGQAVPSRTYVQGERTTVRSCGLVRRSS